MKSSYLIRNVLDLLYEKGELGAKPCSSPMAQAYILLEKANCLGTLRDTEDWSVS